MNKPAWAAFWTIGLIWGSSFLLIRIGVEDIPATELVLIRTTIAAVLLNLVRYLRGIPLPTDWPTIRAFILIGIGNATIPFTLISLGEQNIPSGMAAVIQATASLFTLVIAHFAFADERMTVRKVIGLVIGFSGVVVLSSESIEAGSLDLPTLLGQLAIVVASLFYASSIVYSRKVIRRQIGPMVISSATFIPAAVAAALFTLLEPLLGGRAFISPAALPQDSLLAVLGLGFFNTFIAYMLFYFIIRELGAFRASMVTYIVPVVGLILGWLVLNESFAWPLLLGAVMILTGIGIVNLQPGQLRKAQSQPAEVTSAQ